MRMPIECLPDPVLSGLAGTALMADAAAATERPDRAVPGPERTAGERWYRSPIVWIAVAMLAASIAACIVTIVLALGQPDDALPGIGERLFSVPAAAEGGR